jgi:hypothetical protein
MGRKASDGDISTTSLSGGDGADVLGCGSSMVMAESTHNCLKTENITNSKIFKLQRENWATSAMSRS